MCGRAVHPTEAMRDHARAIYYVNSMRDMVERLGKEIDDRQQLRKEAKRRLKMAEQHLAKYPSYVMP